MPRLIPTDIRSKLINLVVPSSIRHDAIEWFVVLTRDITLGLFKALVEHNVSLWQECIPLELKVKWCADVGDSDVPRLSSLVDEVTLLGWTVEARPDLKTLFNSPRGRLWFFRQIAEIRRELGV